MNLAIWIIWTLHDCPSQMNENLLIINSKWTSDSELIWWRWSTNLSSFVRDSHVGCVLYNGKDNRWQIYWYIQIKRNVRVLSNHERALLAHQCTFGEKIARFNISQFYVIEMSHRVPMIIYIAEFNPPPLAPPPPPPPHQHPPPPHHLTTTTPPPPPPPTTTTTPAHPPTPHPTPHPTHPHIPSNNLFKGHSGGNSLNLCLHYRCKHWPRRVQHVSGTRWCHKFCSWRRGWSQVPWARPI